MSEDGWEKFQTDFTNRYFHYHGKKEIKDPPSKQIHIYIRGVPKSYNPNTISLQQMGIREITLPEINIFAPKNDGETKSGISGIPRGPHFQGRKC